jgi:lysophosphatidylcholine acyltransferase/lyso-PAF acetyltransferase
MTVQPVVLKYKWKNFSPTWEGIPFLQHAIYMNCIFEPFMIEVHRLPPFKPSEHLFETFKDKGSEKWEIFAWAVREAMAEFGDFKLSD